MSIQRPLVQRHKKLARTLLYLAPVAIWFVAEPAIRELGDLGIRNDWAKIDYDEYESFRLLRDYLRIDSSYPDGNEIPAVEFLAEQLEKEGIEAHIQRLGVRNANLWATLEGANPRPLVLHQHVDVDPVLSPELWQAPPFAAEYRAPHVVGRGAFDMKSVGIAQLMAVLELRRSGVRLNRSVKILATGDEERDSFLGTQRVLAEHPEWARTFWAVLTEGGAVEALSAEEVKYWGTEFQQKRFVVVWVCSSDRQRLEDLRKSVHFRGTERRLTETVRIFFPRYGPSRARSVTRELLASPDTILESIRTFPRELEAAEFPPLLEAHLRDQSYAFPVEEDPEGGYRFQLVVHLLPDSDFDIVFEKLVGDSMDGFQYVVENYNEKVPPSPIDHPVFQAIDEGVSRLHPGVDHGPLFLAWSATDARYFREVGIPSYGFSPFLLVSQDSQSSKGPNERIPAPAFIAGVQLYEDVVRRLVAED
ncbi:MAG: M20/M25/M40 family metallo-hydrolase [Thermoanaerobaculia bacterium]|nr:M20/M25/M40 family metallo-hydrolase [Thermoanaerobaculia bacterium]